MLARALPGRKRGVQESGFVAFGLLKCCVMLRVQDYFRLMVEQKASDLHLSSNNRPMFRVAGNMMPVNDQVLSAEEVKSLIGEIIPANSRQEWEQCHDTDFAYELD